MTAILVRTVASRGLAIATDGATAVARGGCAIATSGTRSPRKAEAGKGTTLARTSYPVASLAAALLLIGVVATAARAGTTSAARAGSVAITTGTGATATVIGTDGSALGALSTAAESALVAGSTTLMAAGPAEWITLGSDEISFDSYRAVLHDYDIPEPRGRSLHEVANDSRVIDVRAETRDGYWPQLWLRNQWEEEFRIDYITLPNGEIAAHATLIS